MNSTIHTVSGLLAGAFFNLGFVRLAERLDPLTRSSGGVETSEMAASVACISCTAPTELAVRA